MKKNIVIAVMLTLSFLLGSLPSVSQGVTLKTTSIFTGADAAADTYLGLLKNWQERTGNIVLDVSSTSDEAWKTGVLNDFAAGNEADILFFFAKTAESALILNKVVPINDINAAYPQVDLVEDADVAENDGVVYAIPIRSFWEALFCNVGLFDANHIELPTTWEKLETAIREFRKLGITPIALSLSDVPHYIAEYCILSCGSQADHRARPKKGEPVPQSWIDGMELIRRLSELGAFPAQANATTNDQVSQLFLDKSAAMQLEGSWFANGMPKERMKDVIVLPFPAYTPQANPNAFIGGVSMGFYLSRAAWEDEEKRDAAVDLLAFLTTGENAASLGGYTFTGSLLDSCLAMTSDPANMNPPLQDAMDPAARAYWFSSIPGVVDGSIDPATLWEEIMALDPFHAANGE
ncbi:MAG: carbohydrate ABC transporter substrate-binding protein [Clostridiales bacterium]|nr:carbohydrate ABC transporter substrate-binding protein [Clostridiales bacterium]